MAGLTIGLFVAFLVYLRELPVPNESDNPKRPVVDNSKPKPVFNFYDILPELEVVVPDLEVKPKDQKTQTAETKTPSPTPQLAAGEKFILQVGSFNQFDEADKLKAHLALLGIEAFIQKVAVDNKQWHRVRIGPFEDRKTLNLTRKQLQENSIEAITLKVST